MDIAQAVQNIRQRFTLGGAVGYDLYRMRGFEWDVSAGPAYQKTEFISVEAGKSATEVAAVPGNGLSPEAAKAMEEFKTIAEKANAGYALVNSTVEKVLALVGGQSRDPAGATPPVGELFKGSRPGKEGRLKAAYAAGTITASELDKGIDTIGRMAPGMPPDVIEISVGSCSPAVQAILRAAA